LSWLGCGCAGLMTVVMALVVTATVATWRANERFDDELADPAARTTRARSILPFTVPPPGYYPVGGVEMPLGMLRMAVFAGREPGAAGEEPVESGFFYVSMPDWLGRKAKFREVFSGEAGPPGGISQAEVEFEAREEIGRGEVSAGGAQVLYYARRGPLSIDPERFGAGPKGGERHRFDGIATMLFFDCPDDSRLRVGLWLAPDPAPQVPVAEADLSGTPGDPQALIALLDRFQLCS
jgi:hypothetical protein